MAKIKFDRGNVIIGGATAAEFQDASLEVDNGSAEVISLKEYLGVSEGPVMGTVTVKRAVPRAGFAQNQRITNAVIKQQFVTVILITGAEKYSVTGVIKSKKGTFSVTATSMEDFSLHGDIKIENL